MKYGGIKSKAASLLLMSMLGSTSLAAASKIGVFIDLDNWEDETSWTLKDPGGNTIASGGTYANDDEYIYVETSTDQGAGTYQFEISDSSGDGLNDPDSDSDSDGVAYYQITLDGVVIHRSTDNENFGSSDTVDIVISDRDGDGFNDASDPDEDGDGVIDSDEMDATGRDISGTWSEDTAKDEVTVSTASGTTAFSEYTQPTAGDSDWTYDTSDTFNNNNGADLWSTPNLTGKDSLTIKYGDAKNVGSGDTRRMVVKFSDPQTSVVIHYDRIGGYTNNGPISVEMTLANSGVTMTRLSGNDQFKAENNKIYRDLSVACDQSESDSASNFTAAGSVKFNSTSPFTELVFDVDMIVANSGDKYGDFFEIIVEADTYAEVDTDGDGVNDTVDLDSDNDGIPDNVETQTTNGFTVASGNDTDGDGIDDAYDPDNGGTATSLIDTDGDGTPDIYDLDSDGDGKTDCEEGLSGTACPVDNADVGANGLVSTSENNDDWSEPAGTITDPSSDLQNQEGDTSEVAYRETKPDTDGDGIPDDIDIDDDNDGILDAIEIQGGGNCVYGFFHVIDGVLNIFDSENSLYLSIGGQKLAYNGLGYDDATGKLYAVAREDGTDDYGTSLLADDIIEVDRYTGKIKKATNSMDTYAADFYNGALYGRVQIDRVKVWDKASNTRTNIDLDDDINWADLSILPDGNTPMAYGLRTNNETSGTSNNTDFYRVNLSDGTTSITAITVTTPDGNDLNKGWGATFISNENGEYHLYAANNNGYIYEIENFVSGTPTANFVYSSEATNSNDGASCRNANQYAVDTDGDGIPDYHDLDSDNDGIPDNVEAQTTTGFTAPSGAGSNMTDADGDGLDDNYDNNTSDAFNSIGSVPPDSDKDGIPDYLDTDSDNDGYTDCEEGIDPSQGTTCPLTGVVGNNGMVDSLENADDYTSTNNGITNPDPDNGGTDLLNEYADSNNPEAAYREFLCGKAEYRLTEMQWRLISVPCDTGSASIETLFGAELGTYETNWVMYRQSALDPNDPNDDNFEVNASHDNTNKTKLASTDTVEQGVSYWIITDANHTVTIDKTISGLAPTGMLDANATPYSINNPDFEKVSARELPNGTMNVSGNEKKFMAGNPFPYAFMVKNLYFSADRSTDGTYKPMGDSDNDTYIYPKFYKHDSSDTSDKNVSDGGGYEVIDASTPGFDNGGIKAMEGFFIKIEEQAGADNGFAYPLVQKNGSGN